jgi:asparagine synthase (glutamine-hydrolysing)
VALTRRWPAYPETDESAWQELVIKSLSLADWEKVDFEENDVIGPTCAPSLRRLGPLWPPLLHSWPPMFEKARGGSFVTGEGGDEVFGPRRCAWLRRALWRRPTRASLVGTSLSLAPRRIRRQAALREVRRELPAEWLLPHSQARYHELLADDEADEPLGWPASMQWQLRRRSPVVGSHNLALLAAEHGTALCEPLLDPDFVASLSAVAGSLGFPGRTRAMRAVFGRLLPDELLARSTKAYTTSMVFGPWSRQFIEQWPGDGVDQTLVDSIALQRAWAADSPPIGTMLLLQQAWLRVAGPAETQAIRHSPGERLP